MQIFHGLPDAPFATETTLTIGVFDGVHLGHQALIGRAMRRARETRRQCVVLTFDPHPVEVLAPHVTLRYLTTIGERARLVEELGADFFCVLPFTVETARTSARDFVRPLVERLRMRDLVIGYDFTLGHKRQGDAKFLRALGDEWDFIVEVVDAVWRDGEIVSSTRIRRELAAGHVSAANQLLGHRYSLVGCLPDELAMRVDVKRRLPSDGSYECVLTGHTQQTTHCDARVEGDLIRFSDDRSSRVRRDAPMRALSGTEVKVEFVRERPSPDAMSGEGYEEIGHTADVALRVRAATFADLLRHAARGMFALMADTPIAQATHEQPIEASGADNETLLVNWLSELLYMSETTRQMFSDFEVQLVAPDRVRGVARGAPAGEIRKQIKAVTFHDLRIEQHDGLYETTIVFDI